MKITKKKLILLIIPLIILGLFIIYLNLAIENFVETEIIDLSYQYIKDNDAYLNSTVKIINKSPFNALINNVYIEAYYENIKIGYSEFKEQFELQKEKIITLPFKLNLNELKKIIKDLVEVNETEISYKAKASASINFIGFWIGKDVNIEGKVKLNVNFLYKSVSWKIDINYIKVIGRNETNLFAKTNVNITNYSPFDITINKGRVFILNDIGYLEIKDKIELKSKEVKKLDLDLIINVNQATVNMISEIVNEGKANIHYKAELNVYIRELDLNLNVSIKNNTNYISKSIKDLIIIDKIYLLKGNTKILIYLINEYGLDFILKDSTINLFYNNYNIGKINVPKNLKIESNITKIEANIEINQNNLRNAINDLINNKKITIEAQFNGNLNILNKDISVSFNLKQDIKFEPFVDFEIINVAKTGSNMYYAEVKLNSSINDILLVEFFIKKANFEIFYDDKLFGNAELAKPITLITNNPTRAEIIIKASESLKGPITKIINGEELKLNVKNIALDFNLIDNSYSIVLNEIDLNIQKINLNPNIKAEINRVTFLNSKEVEIEITAFINLGDIPKITFNVNRATADLYLDNELITKVNLSKSTIITEKSKNSFILKALVKKEVNNLIEKFLNNELVRFQLKNLNISLEVLGESLEVEYNKDIEITLEKPIKLSIEGIIENVSFANIEKHFDVKFKASLNSSININNVRIIDINADIYLKDKFITKINLDLNLLIQSNYVAVSKTIRIKLDESTFKEIIEIVLSNKQAELSLRNIIANSKLGNEDYQINLNNVIALAKVPYEINVYIPDFQIQYPGNKLTAEFSATIKGFNFGLMPDELILDAYLNDKKVAQIRLISIYNPSNYLMRGVLEAEFTQEGLNMLATPLVQGKKIFIFVNSAKVKVNINGLYLNDILNFENPVLVIINHNFVLNYSIKILDIQNKYPGDIFPVKLLISYEYKNGVNIPLTVKSAKFEIYNATHKLGEGYIKGDVLLSSNKGNITVESELLVYRAHIGWFIEKFLFSDTFSIILDNIIVNAKAYNYEVEVALNKLIYTEKEPKVTFNVERYSIVSVSQAGIIIDADISFVNPYNITALITYLPASNRTISFNVYESNKEAHPGLNLGYGYYTSEYQIQKMQKNVIKNVRIVITNAAHLLLAHDYDPNPFAVHIKIYVDAKGVLGLRLYEVYTKVNFNINNIYIEFRASIL
jgi:LEA14-like dessication related protein